MKTVARLAVILFFVGLVAGGAWLIGGTAEASQFATARRERPTFDTETDSFARPDRGDHDHHHGNTAAPLDPRSWLGFAKTLLPITLIFGIVALSQQGWARLRQKPKANPDPVRMENENKYDFDTPENPKQSQ